jgi:nucleotide-binding universal stress UspA family protein
MVFRRRADKRPPLLAYQRILVPLAGNEADDVALRLVAALLAGQEAGEASLLHVIEVTFDRQLDAEDAEAVAFADEILGHAEQFLAGQGVRTRTGVVQARAAGAAIVDEAVEWGADLIVMGLRYKKRMGGAWDAGRTVPYVMRNSQAPVWCLRVETEDLARTP